MLLSLCIPTYNRCFEIQKCLKSIVSQDIFLLSDQFEVVISDNCSTDDTQKICEDFVSLYPDKIRYIRQMTNIGPSSNAHKILHYSRAKFSKIHNDTLVLLPGGLSFILNSIKMHQDAAALFFINKPNKFPSVMCSSVDKFINVVSFYSGWIGGLCINLSAFNQIKEPHSGDLLLLPQLEWNLQLLKEGQPIFVFFEKIMFSLPLVNKGGYNIAEIFGQNYISILKKYYFTGHLKKISLEKEKFNILFRHTIPYYFDVHGQYSFSCGNYLYFMRDYRYNVYFYLSFIYIGLLYLYAFLKRSFFFVRFLLGFSFHFFRLVSFKSKWRLKNAHNKTVLGTVFSINNVNVGNYSYGILNVQSFGHPGERLEIGHFVSIARDVVFLLGGNHSYSGFSTYPFNVLFFNQKTEAQTKGPIIVQDDVWIGERVLILSGVTIGQGAIVGAGSVVSKDVPPYAIVVGNPAKVVKYRFEPALIKKMLQLDFSLFTEDIIIKNRHFFDNSFDGDYVDHFMKIIGGSQLRQNKME